MAPPASFPHPLLPPLDSPESIASPPAPALDYGVRLDETGIQKISSEGAQGWPGTTVTFRLGDGKTEVAKPDSSGLASVSHSESVNRKELPFDVDARRVGPHTQPIFWTLDGGAPHAPLTKSAPLADVEVSTRLRLSAWTQGEYLWDPSTALVDRKKYATASGFDDLTLTQTVRMKALPAATTDEEKRKNDEMRDDVDWANNFLTDAGIYNTPLSPQKKDATPDDKAKAKEAVRLGFLKDAIQYFHARRIQIFVGFEIVAEKKGTTAKDAKALEEDHKAADRYKEWISRKKEDPADFAAHAKKLVAFFDDKGLDIDGISYDIEMSGLGDAYVARMKALFMAVASELRKKGRYLAYATRAFRSYTKSDSANDKKDDFLREQPFSLAAEAPDIIARPMSYDLGTKGREDMFKFALTTDKLHPAQFQVGLGTVATNNPISHDDFDKECKNTWMGYRAGVIHWAMKTGDDAKQLARHNQALNPKDQATGRVGQPLQGPLNAARVKVLDDAAQAEKKSGQPSQTG